MAYDIWIKSGIIIDGTGNPRYQGDIAVQGGRIVDVAPSLTKAEARNTINAFGKFVTPGFIDLTSHADKNWSLFLNPGQDYLLTQGVTSILVGNCGSSLAPLVSRESVEAIRKWDPASQININWTGVGEFLDELSRHPLGVNVATLMGHGTIRRGILKGESRPLNTEELHQFSSLLIQGIKEGAFGLSTGLVYSHEAAATLEELTSLAKVLANTNGIYKTHLRNEGPNLMPAMNEAVQISRESKAGVVISHFKAIGRKSWPLFARALRMIERAAENDTKIHFDISPYQRTGSFLYLLLPAWARQGGFPVMLQRLAQPEHRQAVIEELKRQTLHYDRYIVANSTTPNTNGNTIAEVAQRLNQSPEETLLELLTANQGKVTVFGKTLSFKNIVAGISHPLSIIASDGSGVSPELGRSGKLVHPRSTGCFPHFLHRFVKEKELISWEEGIKKITSLPAELAGFKNRGRIQKNYHADIAVFDPEKIRDRSTYQNPYVHSSGIEAVVVNGKLALENGQITGVAAGQVLKKS